VSMLGDYKRLVEAPMIRDYEDQIAALRAEIERLTTPSQGLDAATVERCAQVLDTLFNECTHSDTEAFAYQAAAKAIRDLIGAA